MTAAFDPSKAYKHWDVDGKAYGDGREVRLLEHIYNLPELEELRGRPGRILEAIDEFGKSDTGLINIGQVKGTYVIAQIEAHKPQSVLELGGYIGYSAIMFGNAMKQAGGKKYYSVEKSPLFAAIATSFIDLAGLRDYVQVVVGSGGEGIQRLHTEGILRAPLGLAFFDHHKPSYTADLKLCERLGLIAPGTVIIGDNMIIPGNPPYLEWVRATVEEKRLLNQAASAADNGNPNLQYTSKFVKSFEPSGLEDAMEITQCLGVAA